ncbi:MBL fold metallo-hydrolase [Peptoniphilus sp. KCTC 25270]|uniref:MBL fold metallo-hydrolase n=1 Tax=Peptoniphilus sp. KCTC 25270 TaxID=2897414 RepID=UPI001E2ABEAE|nr:MBL fold metallo-hydrolase [Peptoniphilus sp. KCTC 25270]MCD1147654.1 MBL fold metallo-hydrolase [Peptoniphilus sp. KCTC 25270]
MEKIREGIYHVTIPLKGNPLKSINIYIFSSKGENMIVDTGFHTEEIIEETEKFIKELNLDLSKTRLFLTHLHSDHTGLAHYYDEKDVPIFMGEVDGRLCREMQNEFGWYWQGIGERALKQGLAEDELSIHDHPGFRFRPKVEFRYTPVNPGDKVDVGDFHFTVIDEEGHTPGMVGLYEEEKKILVCGDHILGKITPNITYWGDQFGDSLGVYLKNIEKIKDMPIDLLLSSHRYLIDDVPARIEELKGHHEFRLQQVREIIHREGEANIRTITKNLSWDISAKNWDEFPKSQKFFAAGEAQAHVEHLVALGQATREEDEEGIYIFRLTDLGEEIRKKNENAVPKH